MLSRLPHFHLQSLHCVIEFVKLLLTRGNMVTPQLHSPLVYLRPNILLSCICRSSSLCFSVILLTSLHNRSIRILWTDFPVMYSSLDLPNLLCKKHQYAHFLHDDQSMFFRIPFSCKACFNGRPTLSALSFNIQCI